MCISVICVFNNQQQYESQLLTSLNAQNTEYELIPVDNRNGAFSSAAKALNYGAAKAHGNVLIFSHQDIFLKAPNELEELAKAIADLPDGNIVGTQGVREPSRIYYENLTAGNTYNGELLHNYEKQLYPVSCVDEGLFGMTANTWKNHPFDEVLCNNWHLYCVEACLFARSHGHCVYVYPSQIHHFSRGKISLGYMKNLKTLCKVYRKDFKYIWTTCYKVRTNPVFINGLYAAWVTNRLIRGKLK